LALLLGRQEGGGAATAESRSYDEAAARESITVEIDKLEELVETLDTCLAAVEINNDLHPFVVLGIPAQSGLTTSIISGAISFYGVIYTLYQQASVATR
jgi:hypothetical protein